MHHCHRRKLRPRLRTLRCPLLYRIVDSHHALSFSFSKTATDFGLDAFLAMIYKNLGNLGILALGTFEASGLKFKCLLFLEFILVLVWRGSVSKNRLCDLNENKSTMNTFGLSSLAWITELSI